MEKTIIVTYNLYDSKDYVNIPVRYVVETEGKREIYKCSVELKEQVIPEWLTVTSFEIPTVYEPTTGVSVTLFSEVKGIKSVDTALFIGQVYRSIFVKESWDAMHK